MKTELLRRIKTGLETGIGPVEENEFSHALYTCRYPDGVIRCLECNSEKVYRLANNRYRCGRCKYTYGAFTGTWLGLTRIPLKAWLNLLLAFTDNKTTQQAVQLGGVSFPTVLRVFHIVRQSIAVSEEPLLMQMGGGLARLKGNQHKSRRGVTTHSGLVFGLTQRSRHVEIHLIPEMTIAELIQQPVRLVKKGGLIYTDTFMQHDTLLAYVAAHKANKLDKPALFTKGTVYADRHGGFMSFLRQSLARHHRIEQNKFPYYLYEYKHRYQDSHTFFDSVLFMLNQPVPEV